MAKFGVLLFSLIAAIWATPIEYAPIELQTDLAIIDIDTRQSGPDIRLNDDVLPIHYDVMLKPYFEAEGTNAAFTFDGNVKILLRATKLNVVQITMHANQMDINDNWRVYEANNPAVIIPHPPHTYDQATNKLTLNLNRVLQTDRNYIVEINFVGQLSDAMTGFYRSYYMENGVRK
jgi:aminopeptidase N